MFYSFIFLPPLPSIFCAPLSFANFVPSLLSRGCTESFTKFPVTVWMLVKSFQFTLPPIFSLSLLFAFLLSLAAFINRHWLHDIINPLTWITMQNILSRHPFINLPLLSVLLSFISCHHYLLSHTSDPLLSSLNKTRGKQCFTHTHTHTLMVFICPFIVAHV